MHIKLCVVIAIWCLNNINAFDENNKFCIRTEPMLLTDTKNHVNPQKDDTQCETIATTLTVKEKEDFIANMCKDHGSLRMAELQFFKLRNGDLTGRASHQQICNGHGNPLLAWIPYESLKTHYAQELNPKEHMEYIAKATDPVMQKSEFCHFGHTDLTAKSHPKLFTCSHMALENNIFDSNAQVDVLVEIQPIMYEVRNVSYLPWANVSASYKTLLGRATMKNPSRSRKQIYGSINYAYVEKIKLNASAIYAEHLEQLPLLFEHKGAVLEIDDAGIGGLEVKEKAYFGRIMDAQTAVAVDVIGQWAEYQQQFNADIYEYFGYAIKRFKREIHGANVAFVRIDSTDPVFEALESTHLTNASVYEANKTKQQNAFARLTTAAVDNSTEKASKLELEEEYPPRGGHPYPGFYPWFVAGALAFGIVLLAAVIGMVRSCSKRGEKKHKYQLTKP